MAVNAQGEGCGLGCSNAVTFNCNLLPMGHLQYRTRTQLVRPSNGCALQAGTVDKIKILQMPAQVFTTKAFVANARPALGRTDCLFRQSLCYRLNWAKQNANAFGPNYKPLHAGQPECFCIRAEQNTATR